MSFLYCSLLHKLRESPHELINGKQEYWSSHIFVFPKYDQRSRKQNQPSHFGCSRLIPFRFVHDSVLRCFRSPNKTICDSRSDKISAQDQKCNMGKNNRTHYHAERRLADFMPENNHCHQTTPNTADRRHDQQKAFRSTPPTRDSGALVETKHQICQTPQNHIPCQHVFHQQAFTSTCDNFSACRT